MLSIIDGQCASHSSGHSSNHSSCRSKARRSSESASSSAESESTARTSVAGSPRIEEAKTEKQAAPPIYVYSRATAPPPAVYYYEAPRFEPTFESYDEDLSPATNCYPRGSTETYMSGLDSLPELERERWEDDHEEEHRFRREGGEEDDEEEDDEEEDDEEEDEEEEEEVYVREEERGTKQRERELEDDLSDSSDDDNDEDEEAQREKKQQQVCGVAGCVIPPLPEYRHDVVDSTVRPSEPHEFAQLYPSLNRMTIRHDEFTTDGNMNLRVDMPVPTHSARRPTASFQLFHLRMYDLARREFSLRRYSRDSGREVCNSKLKLVGEGEKEKEREKSELASLSSESGPSLRSGGRMGKLAKAPRAHIRLQRSMTSALRSLGMGRPLPKRAATAAASYGPTTAPSASPSGLAASLRRTLSTSSLFFDRHSIGGSSSSNGDGNKHAVAARPPRPTNTIRLEFSNYARVDVRRRGGSSRIDCSSLSSSPPSSSSPPLLSLSSASYEFSWWGHNYVWKCVPERHLQVVTYHLLRDGHSDAPIAHIVPEMRSPNQIQADEVAGGWVPPCHMWISDESVLHAETDVADVIMATGLIALVDDCIRSRWQQPRKTTLRLPSVNVDHAVGPKALMQHVFHRRSSHSHRPSDSHSSCNSSHGNHSTGTSTYASSPLRYAQPVSAY